MLLPLAVAACGDRTGLFAEPTTASASATDSSRSCAPDPPALLVSDHEIQTFGNIAGSECSFGMTWQENRGNGLANAARTAQVVGGAWVLSPPVTITGGADLGVDGNPGFIGWDGSAYTVAWSTGGTLFLRRMAADGKLLGPSVRSVTTGIDAYPIWIDPSPADGTLRLALLDDRSERFQYRVYFLKLRPDGGALVPATALTPASESPSVGGFARLPSGDTVMFWSGDDNVRITFSESFFDDHGVSTRPTTSLMRPVDASRASYLPGGVAQVGADVYFGVLAFDGTDRSIVGMVTTGGTSYTSVTGVPGADVPTLAATAAGVVGVLSDRSRTANSSSDLLLSFVTQTTATATQVVSPNDGVSDSYAVAAGSDSLGVFWETPGFQLKFTVRTP